MARDLSGTNLRNAIDIDGSYYMLTRLEVSPSRIYFDALMENYPFSGADAIGVPLVPVKEDIEWSPVDELLYTFFSNSADSNHLSYAIEGSSTIHDMNLVCDGKPGILGSYLATSENYTLTFWSINWSTMGLSEVFQRMTSGSICANHVVSSTEAVAIVDDDGGYRPVYCTASSLVSAPQRFMFPTFVISSGSGRSMEEMGVSSGAAKLGNKVFVYISNVQNGYVEGMYYDLDTESWSDIYTALPTDLVVSQCDFKITNVYAHNGTLYMCGQFERLDNLSGSQPYTLVLQSLDGRTFSLDRHTLVSNLGYRFLARVAGGRLYLSNCNRVCYADLTWVFDGTSGSAGRVTTIPIDDIKAISDQNVQTITISLRAGKEQYFDHADVIEGARMRAYFGMKTPEDEYVKYGTYIIDDMQNVRASSRRGSVIKATNESMWKLTGLTMPFYAELLGKSVYFDPMSSDATELTTAAPAGKTVTKFAIDMWHQEPYTNDARGITGINMIESGGVNFNTSGSAGAHRFGIIHNSDMADIALMDKNPLLTSGSVLVKVYGWSHPATESDVHSDNISLILCTVDENDNESWHFSSDTGGSGYWHFDWPYSSPGVTAPIDIAVQGLTAGHRIKKAGVVFDGVNGTWFNIARLEFMTGVEVSYTYDDADTAWTKETDGTFTVPRAGRPFIMYGQRPYHTANFTLAASFNNNVSSGSCIPNYPVGCGLIGLAEDGSNYILARYNKTNDNVEIVKCRNGIETILAHDIPAFTVHDDHILRFDHKGGHFAAYLVNDTTGSGFEEVVHYDWKASDGYMFTNPTATMKCGIYGCISTPSVRTLGLYPNMSESVSNTDGLGIDPLDSHAAFPTKGKLRLGEDVFSYENKIEHPAYCRGPYQYRQAGVYAPPWGNGNYGLECRDFDWGADPSLINDKLVCISSGCVFKCNGALWQIYTSTGGVLEPRRNRARYYSANQQIGKSYQSLANKVWVVGGFEGIQQTTPTSVVMHHMEGDIAYYEIEGKLKCYWYMGAGGNDDTTVEDLVAQVCALSGARANFPGDTSGSYAAGVSTTIATVEYADGLDISFDTDYDVSFVMDANIKIDPTNYESGSGFQNDTALRISVGRLPGLQQFYYDVTGYPSGYRFYKCIHDTEVVTQKYRILYHLNNLSLYQNGQWVTTVAFDKINYGTSLQIVLRDHPEIRNLRIKELSDWREAVYIDLETDGRSALNSVIQQRVVETIAKSDGSLDFYYEIDRHTINAVRHPRDHTNIRSVPAEGASDAIVQGWYEVKTMQNSSFAKFLGFATKLFRMPDLTSGAYRAVKLTLKKMFESYRRHSFTIRPDLELEIGDLYHFGYTAFGTKTVVNKTIIVENITTTLSMSGGRISSNMQVSGREKTDEPT